MVDCPPCLFRLYDLFICVSFAVLYLRKGVITPVARHVLSKHSYLHGYFAGSLSDKWLCATYITVLGFITGTDVPSYNICLCQNIHATCMITGAFGFVFNKLWFLDNFRRWVRKSHIHSSVLLIFASVLSGSSTLITGESQSLFDGFNHLDKIMADGKLYSLTQSIKYLVSL